jgi:hypothetical protein
MWPNIQLVAEDIPQVAIGFVKPFLAVNLEDVARPRHCDGNDVFDSPGPVRHYHHAVS